MFPAFLILLIAAILGPTEQRVCHDTDTGPGVVYEEVFAGGFELYEHMAHRGIERTQQDDLYAPNALDRDGGKGWETAEGRAIWANGCEAPE